MACTSRNLQFLWQYPGFQLPDIYIRLYAGGSDSRIGDDGWQDAQDGKPTMNLDLKMDGGDQDIADVLHKFGHILGAVHEHQTTRAQTGITWNRANVLDDMAKKGWSEEEVDVNIFRVVTDGIAVEETIVDPLSIMMYKIPPSWTTNGFSAPGALRFPNWIFRW